MPSPEARPQNYLRRRSLALATFATITANGGIARATTETITAASVEYRPITAQDSTNRPMQVAISPKYQRLSARDGCGPGSLSLSVTKLRCPAAGRPNAAGAAYGPVAVRLVMFRCMFDEGAVLDGLNEQQRRAATHQGAPLAPTLPAVGSLAAKVDTALGALWDG